MNTAVPCLNAHDACYSRGPPGFPVRHHLTSSVPHPKLDFGQRRSPDIDGQSHWLGVHTETRTTFQSILSTSSVEEPVIK